MTVTFDSTELVSATYMTRFAKHESVADRVISSQPRVGDDGEILITERYGKKVIRLQGVLIGSSQSDLESKIDTFVELLSRPEKNLDITYAGGTRRYVATCQKHDFDRDHYHLSIAPWSAEFVVLAGEGKDTTTTQPTAADGDTLSYDPTSDPTGRVTVTIDGTKPPKPTIVLGAFSAGTTIKGIEYLNRDTGERLVVTYPGSWGNSRTITINCDAKTVTGDVVDGVTKDLNFYGVFPSFPIGSVNLQLTCGGIVNQKSADDSISEIQSVEITTAATTNWKGQSFMVPYGDATFQGITLGMKKTGAPGNLTWRIETDNSGEPSGTLADANATGTISAADVTTSFSYIKDFSTSAWTLSANTLYWLVLKQGATADGSNYYSFALAADSTYPRGKARYTNDSGSTWEDFSSKTDIVFRILYGGTQATTGPTHTITYTKTYL